MRCIVLGRAQAAAQPAARDPANVDEAAGDAHVRGRRVSGAATDPPTRGALTLSWYPG